MHLSGAVAPLDPAPAQPAEGGPGEEGGAEALEAPAPAPAEEPALAAEQHTEVPAEGSAGQVVTPPSTAAAPSPRLSAGSAKALLPSPPPGKRRRHVQQAVRRPVRVLSHASWPHWPEVCSIPGPAQVHSPLRPCRVREGTTLGDMTMDCTSEALLAVMLSAHQHQPCLLTCWVQHRCVPRRPCTRKCSTKGCNGDDRAGSW